MVSLRCLFRASTRSVSRNMKKKLYAIVDLETTGAKSDRDRITEIAIALHDGERVIDTFESLINPERAIPYNITKITGITQEMVEEAPKFYEVAKTVVEMTEGAVFVAHNVRFDYGFLRAEFKRLGFSYTRKQLCTVRLSRQAFPWIGAYSLAKLIKYFKIKVSDRHRAMADVMATVEVFERILDMEEGPDDAIDQMINRGVKESRLPANISLPKLHELPEECGVYYFHDRHGEVIYVGKSINIKSRIMQHFADESRKGAKIAAGVHDISYELTGSELVALLLESDEIKNLRPKINRAQRARSFPYIIHHYENEAGYQCLDIAKVRKNQKKDFRVLREFSKLTGAKGALNRLLEQYELCQKYCHVDQISTPCFYYHINKCRGACIEEEDPETYNERVQRAIEAINIDFGYDFIAYDKGRHAEEKAVILVENGQYQGYGYIDLNDSSGQAHEVREAISPRAHNPEVARIILQYLQKKKVERLLRLDRALP